MYSVNKTGGMPFLDVAVKLLAQTQGTNQFAKCQINPQGETESTGIILNPSYYLNIPFQILSVLFQIRGLSIRTFFVC